MTRKINRKFMYSFLGICSFIIGTILLPFPSSKNGGSLGIDGSTAHAEAPTPDPDPDPCPDPDPSCI